MAQQQYQISQIPPQAPGRPFSPTQPSPSSGASQAFSLPPTKRQKLSPDPRLQPPSPYLQSPYTMSSSPTTTTPTHFNHISLPPNIYTTPYSNDHTTSAPTINLTASSSNSVPNHTAAQTGNRPSQPVNGPAIGNNNNSLHPSGQLQGSNITLQGTGAMGPPSKPAERDSANDDQMDVLTNAGVDIRAEEIYAMSFHTGSFKPQQTISQPISVATGHAFTQFGPGDAASLYGAGPANQTASSTDGYTQEELEKKAADQAWADAAMTLALSRQHELENPHVNVHNLWSKMERITRDNGLILHSGPSKMPSFKATTETQGDVEVRTVVGPQAAMTVTNGSFPPDPTITDQLALLSLATNQRIRVLLEEAVAVARGRRAGSQGIVPAEWADVAKPISISSGTVVINGPPRDGWESAVSPLTNPLKRSLSSANRLPTPVSDGAKTPTTSTIAYNNDLVEALRNSARLERSFEEARLLKRQNRLLADGTSRPSSNAPGTLGPVAPEPTGKPLTKKEREKQDKGKQSMVDSHAQANATTNKFLFGAKSKNKYSWMTGGASASSGANTPAKIKTQGLPGTPGGISGGEQEKLVLTADGINKMGAHREDKKEPGPLVELRDLAIVLENDGREAKILQEVYAWVETPKSKRL